MLLGEWVRAGRSLLRWSQKKLAEEASKIHPVSVDTIKKWEAINGPISANTMTAGAVRTALESAGVEFIPENGGGPGVRLKK